MIKVKYGELPKETLEEYKKRLVGRVYKILPMKEEKCETWEVYIESLLFELVGNKKMVDDMENNADFISLLSSLEGIMHEEDISVIKREVFKCLGLVKKF